MLTKNRNSLFFNEDSNKEKFESISVFFRYLMQYLKGEITEDKLIQTAPNFTKNKQVLDSHQGQHLGGRSDSSSFKFKNSAIINILAQCINKIISRYYRKNRSHNKNEISESLKDSFASYRKYTTFCIEMGFVICDKDMNTHKPATGIVLTPFGDSYYHIYPVDLENFKYRDTKKCVLINADEILHHLQHDSALRLKK